MVLISHTPAGGGVSLRGDWADASRSPPSLLAFVENTSGSEQERERLWDKACPRGGTDRMVGRDSCSDNELSTRSKAQSDCKHGFSSL